MMNRLYPILTCPARAEAVGDLYDWYESWTACGQNYLSSTASMIAAAEGTGRYILNYELEQADG